MNIDSEKNMEHEYLMPNSDEDGFLFENGDGVCVTSGDGYSVGSDNIFVGNISITN